METKTVVLGGKKIVLVGTAHVSEKSIETVRAVIEREHPDVVGVELDAHRYHSLMHEHDWKETSILQVIKEGKAYLFLASLMLAGFQKRVGQELGVKPGSEMIAAVEAARGSGARVALLDRDVNTTLRRAFALTGLWEKTKILSGIVLSGILPGETIDAEKVEQLKQQDALNSVLEELAREMPGAKKVLVDERNAFIAEMIFRQPAQKMVVVVGMGHVQGIRERLEQGVREDIAPLLQVPAKKNFFWLLKFLVPLAFVVLLALTFSSHGLDISLHALVAWVVINGGLSALGVLLARGHPFSILAAFIAAPITTLHPFLASGWVAGFVEAKMRQPKVRDFEGLQNIQGYGDLPKNAVTRILLVVAAANIGSTIGTIIGLSYIATALG